MPPTVPTDQAIYAAHPLIEVDGRTHDLLISNLVALSVVEGEGGLSALEATFTNTRLDDGEGAGFAFEHAPTPLALGAELKVGMGEAGSPGELFRGRITGLEAVFAEGDQPRLTVLAEDALLRARLRRRSRTHPAGTLEALVRAVADIAGLRPVIDGLDAMVGVQVQLDETDLGFLRRVLARHDADCQAVGGELHAAPRASVQRGELTLAWPGMVRRVRVLADLAHQVTAVTWSGFDVVQGQAIDATSGTGADLGPGRGQPAADLLRQSFSERSEHLGALACADQAEAQALVDAALAIRARRFVRYEAECSGDPRLRVGSHVTFSGLGPRFGGTAYVVRVRHRYDLEHGYACDLTAESARFGGGDD